MSFVFIVNLEIINLLLYKKIIQYQEQKWAKQKRKKACPNHVATLYNIGSLENIFLCAPKDRWDNMDMTDTITVKIKRLFSFVTKFQLNRFTLI